MAIAALPARLARTSSVSPLRGAASGGESTASAPPTSPLKNIGSTSSEPLPATTRPTRFPASTSRLRSHPSRILAGSCPSSPTSVRPPPSRNAIAAVAPSPARAAAVRTTSRCSAGTPPVVAVKERATALTRSTPMRPGESGGPAAAPRRLRAAKDTARQFGFLAAGKSADVRQGAHHDERCGGGRGEQRRGGGGGE